MAETIILGKDSFMNGICHIEIPSGDLDRVSKFYGTVFGWESTYYKEMDYSVWKAPEGVAGGFSKQLKTAQKDTGALLYIQVADIEDCLKKIEKSGGKMIKGKSPIPGVGHMAIFKDTEGNDIGLFSA